jgi:ribosomal protein S11
MPFGWPIGIKSGGSVVTRNKVKFSISIKDLAIHFEGDQQTGQSVQEGVQESLEHLLSAPSRILGIEDKSTVDATDVRPAKRKRRASPV